MLDVAHQKTKKVTVRFSKNLRTEMLSDLMQKGYGLHGKSKWLTEAVLKFIASPQFIECVEHGMKVNQGELVEVEAFYLKVAAYQQLKDAVLNVRRIHPLFEGVQSAIVRASVINQLINLE